jgi:hypothetical protein
MALGLLMAAIGAAATYRTQQEALNLVVARANKEMAVCQTEKAAALEAAGASRSEAALVQARLSIYRAADQLVARNFGTAEAHLRDSAAMLGEACDEPPCDTESLQKSLETHRFSPSDDLATSITEVGRFGTAIDEHLPKPK